MACGAPGATSMIDTSDGLSTDLATPLQSEWRRRANMGRENSGGELSRRADSGWPRPLAPGARWRRGLRIAVHVPKRKARTPARQSGRRARYDDRRNYTWERNQSSRLARARRTPFGPRGWDPFRKRAELEGDSVAYQLVSLADLVLPAGFCAGGVALAGASPTGAFPGCGRIAFRMPHRVWPGFRSTSVGALSGVSTFTFFVSATFSSGTTFWKFSMGLPSSAPCMNSSQIGRAAIAPVSGFPRDTALSS